MTPPQSVARDQQQHLSYIASATYCVACLQHFFRRLVLSCSHGAWVILPYLWLLKGDERKGKAISPCYTVVVHVEPRVFTEIVVSRLYIRRCMYTTVRTLLSSRTFFLGFSSHKACIQKVFFLCLAVLFYHWTAGKSTRLGHDQFKAYTTSNIKQAMGLLSGRIDGDWQTIQQQYKSSLSRIRFVISHV